MEFTYEDKGDKIAITYKWQSSALELEYKIDGNKLIVKDSFGTDVEYIKK